MCSGWSRPRDELTMKSIAKLLPLVIALFALFCFAFSPATVVTHADGDSNDPALYSNDWRTTGPPGGDVRALVVDPSNPDRFYFGTLDGQIYTSSDGGKRWQLLYNFGKPKLFVDNIIVDARNPKVIYVGAHRHNQPGGFFKSTDSGATWREASQLKNEALHSLAQSESDPNTLIAGTFTGVFRSDDAGETWKQLPTQSTPGLIHVESLAIDPRTTNTIYAGTFYLPYKSVDGGQTWKSIKNGIIDDSDIFAIDIDPRDPNHIIASACSGIYESKTAGDSWRKVQGIPSQSRRTRAIMQHPSVPGIVFAGTTEGFWRSDRSGDANSWMVTTSRQLEVNSIAVHPSNPETVYIGTNNYGVMVSHDSGRTFVPSNGGYSGRFANAILPDRVVPDRIYATTINTTTGGGFFFVSEDGGDTWRPSMRNMPSRLIGYSILQDATNPDVIYLGTNLGVYRSLDRGASWSPVWTTTRPTAPDKPAPVRTTARTRKPVAPRATAKRSATAPKPSETVRRAQLALNAAGYQVGIPDGFAGTQTRAAISRFQSDRNLPVTGVLDPVTLAALDPGGGTAAAGAQGEGGSSILTDAVNELVQTVDPETKQPLILAATNSGLYQSSDPAKGWRRISYGSGFDVRTTSISASSKRPETIWVGTTTSGVLVTTDGGQSWHQVDVPTDVPVNVVAQDAQRPSHVYVGTRQAFYLSHDGGQNWQRRGGNLPYGDFTSIMINPRNGDELFVGNAYQNGENGGGVYHSTNGGVTWTRIDPRDRRLPSFRIWSLALDAHNQSTLFVGSHSAGIYVVPRGAERAASSQR